jgi:hypothetical protein
MLPIYIPSRGRADACLTAQVLKTDGIDFNIVVEPQDVDEYKKYFDSDHLVVMDKNNGGIAYVRNYCKKISISRGEQAHWQIDDNIKSFRKREGNKNVVANPKDILTAAEEYFLAHKNVSMCCLRHVMYAWSQTTDLSFNQCMYSAFIVKNDVGCDFRDGTIEDADFTLQVLMKNKCTVIFNRLLMEKVTTGVMKGGNTEISHGGDGRLRRAQKLCDTWPGGFSIVWKNGLPKVHPLRVWGRFKQRPIPI